MWAGAEGLQESRQDASPVACDAPGCEYSPGTPQGCEWQQVHVGPCCWGWGHSSARSQGSQVRKKMDHSLSLFWLAFLSFLPSFLPPNWSPTNLSIAVPTKLVVAVGRVMTGGHGQDWGHHQRAKPCLGWTHMVRGGGQRGPHWGEPAPGMCLSSSLHCHTREHLLG